MRAPDMDYREGISLGVFLTSSHIYGLPERADTFLLKDTTKTDPYRLYSTDVFPHEVYEPESLYGSMPYVTGHSV
jgi:alpha 1,3-glucosidase